jgi:hypothetical protein
MKVTLEIALLTISITSVPEVEIFNKLSNKSILVFQIDLIFSINSFFGSSFVISHQAIGYNQFTNI